MFFSWLVFDLPLRSNAELHSAQIAKMSRKCTNATRVSHNDKNMLLSLFFCPTHLSVFLTPTPHAICIELSGGAVVGGKENANGGLCEWS
jgi:hypothetical protein